MLDEFLAFNFQAVLDVYNIMQDDYHEIFRDVNEHEFDIA
jgi:hypothetical protein